MRYFLELSYNGKAYHGWQIQPNAMTVQEKIEDALQVILKQNIKVFGAGRTDAGVNAKQLFAHFDIETELDKNLILYKLNSYLPKDIAVHNLYKVNKDAHARFNAESRSYLYRISQKKSVFNIDQSYYFKPKLNLENLKAASAILFDYTDFESFSKSNTEVFTYNCTIMEANWSVVDNELHFVIKANRFLRNMVRAIVGTLLNIGVGKLEVNDLHQIIKSKDRSNAGFSVPAHALYLTEVNYPKGLLINE